MQASTPEYLDPLDTADAVTPGSVLDALPRQVWFLPAACILLDVLVWSSCFTGIFLLQTGLHNLPLDTRLLLTGVWPLLSILLTLAVLGGYDRRADMLSLSYLTEHLLGMAVAFGLSLVLVYCFASYQFPVKPGRSTLFFGFVAFVPISVLYRRTICAKVQAGSARKHFLVLGSGVAAQDFFEAYLRSSNRQALRFLDLETRPGAISRRSTAHLDEHGFHAELDRAGSETEGVVLTPPMSQLPEGVRDQLVRIHFKRIPVFTLETFYETHWRRIPGHALEPSWPLQVDFYLARQSPYQHCKRICDVLGSVAALVLLSPLFAAIAVLTLIDSGRPIIFRQNRVGRDGTPFTIYKFRSMRNRAPGSEGDLYTRLNDERITKLGRWLRRTRLDELPQLWNVLRGEMSLIGPRAEWTKCAGLYEGRIPSYQLRHLVKPGITGWAQVNYTYGESEEDAIQKLEYDLYYIRRYSLRLDAMIVVKTLHIIFSGKGQ